MKLTDEQKTQMLKDAIALAERASELLDQCYISHCKAVGITP